MRAAGVVLVILKAMLYHFTLILLVKLSSLHPKVSQFFINIFIQQKLDFCSPGKAGENGFFKPLIMQTLSEYSHKHTIQHPWGRHIDIFCTLWAISQIAFLPW